MKALKALNLLAIMATIGLAGCGNNDSDQSSNNGNPIFRIPEPLAEYGSCTNLIGCMELTRVSPTDTISGFRIHCISNPRNPGIYSPTPCDRSEARSMCHVDRPTEEQNYNFFFSIDFAELEELCNSTLHGHYHLL